MVAYYCQGTITSLSCYKCLSRQIFKLALLQPESRRCLIFCYWSASCIQVRIQAVVYLLPHILQEESAPSYPSRKVSSRSAFHSSYPWSCKSKKICRVSGIPDASIVVSRQGRQIFEHYYGYRDVELGETPNTVVIPSAMSVHLAKASLRLSSALWVTKTFVLEHQSL